MEIDSIPYLIQTIYHEHFYNLPDNMDVTKIKTATCQLNDQSEEYTEFPFMRMGDMQFIDTITVDNLNDPVALPAKYQEILKLGVFERIATARKDIVMKNNYSDEKEEKVTEYVWQTKLAELEWTSPINVMPRTGNHGYRWW
ncbi:hypothetical protein ABER23_17320 [Paenibacillus lautus]|uniref:hypothetical protein n=1 Tax=Paenibacillus lautus TaxID=1401 RepID=UPI003D28B0E0